MDAGRVHWKANQRLVRVSGSLASVSQQAHPVGLKGVGDPHLLPVDHQVVSHSLGGGLTSGNVAATTGFADSEASYGVPKNRGFEKLLLHVVRAEPCQRGR